MEPVKIGLVGVGGMGRSHLRKLAELEEVKLVGVADVNQAAVDAAASEYGVPGYTSHKALIEESGAEAVLIAVPHPFHAPIALDAAARGLHVLCEKPIAVTVSEADAMIEACNKAGVLLGVNFQRRLEPAVRKAKEIIDSGTLGQIYEAEMISTNWYRLQSYYDSGAWRGTWKGEGGGILANQTPHNLDLYAWLVGLPQAVTARVLTRFHHIETENTVHAIMEYPNGMTGYFRATTADPIGVDRVEVHGTHGRLVLERRSVKLCRYSPSIPEHIHNAKDRRSDPFKAEWEEVPLTEPGGDHGEVARRFARAIRYGEPLVATGEDGRRALELANAMHLSGLRRRTVELPLDRAEVDRLFEELRSGQLGVQSGKLAG